MRITDVEMLGDDTNWMTVNAGYGFTLVGPELTRFGLIVHDELASPFAMFYICSQYSNGVILQWANEVYQIRPGVSAPKNNA